MVVEDNNKTKVKPNKLRPLWRDLQAYIYSRPDSPFANLNMGPEEIANVPIGSTKEGLLGFYNISENSPAVRKELAKLHKEEQYLFNRDAAGGSIESAERYRSNKFKRDETYFDPDKFVRAAERELPNLIKQPALDANGLWSDSFKKAVGYLTAITGQSEKQNMKGSSYAKQLSPKEFAKVNPLLERRTPWDQDPKQEGYYWQESRVPYPASRHRSIPVDDLRQIFTAEEWPAVHQQWPERTVIDVNYFTNTPGSQRIADYYGFKAMEDEARREFYNTPPITMVMPRPIKRPESLPFIDPYGNATEDAAVAGY